MYECNYKISSCCSESYNFWTTLIAKTCAHTEGLSELWISLKSDSEIKSLSHGLDMIKISIKQWVLPMLFNFRRNFYFLKSDFYDAPLNLPFAPFFSNDWSLRKNLYGISAIPGVCIY